MTKQKNIPVKILKWTGGVLAFLLVLVLAATWLINREFVQSRIRQAVSERAGNILTFERLRLDLLPQPGLILKNAVISVPGTISGTVQTAVIQPELLQLLKANILIASVSLESPDFTVKLSENDAEETEDPAKIFAETRAEFEAVMNKVRDVAPGFTGQVRRGKLTITRDGKAMSKLSNINARAALEPRGFKIRMDANTLRWGRISANGAVLVTKRGFGVVGMSASGGRSSISDLSARIAFRKRPYLQIMSGRAEIALEDVYERRVLFVSLKDRLKNVKSMEGTVRLTEMKFRGPLLYPERWRLKTEGTLESVRFNTAFFAGPVSIKKARFTATESSITLTDVRGSFLDSSLSGSATIAGLLRNMRSVDMSLNGVARPETLDWINRTFGPSPWLRLRAPITIADLDIGWQKNGRLSLEGRGSIENGPALTLDLDRRPGELRIKRLTVKDGRMGAVLALTRSENVLNVKFKGSLNEEMLNSIFEKLPGKYGRISGDMQALLRLDRPNESFATGELKVSGLVLPNRLPVFIRHLDLSADRGVLTVNSGLLDWAETPVELKGSVTATDQGFRLDLDAGAGSVNVDRLRQTLAAKKNDEERDASEKALVMKKIPLRGVIRFYATDFAYGGYNLKPFRADVLFLPDAIRLKLITATLCGVALGGTVEPFGPEVRLDLTPIAMPQPLEHALQCFGWQDTRITGEFNMHASLKAQAERGSSLPQSLSGNVDFEARDGRIDRAPLLSRIFAFLNVTELLRGELPDLGKGGFAYKSIRIKGEIIKGKLVLEEVYMEGETLNLVAEGNINLAEKTIDVRVLVAPFKTVEYILSKIPVIRNILANRLITVPVRVKGDLNNPEITPLDPTSIGRNLIDIMGRIVALPFKVLDPLFNPEKD